MGAALAEVAVVFCWSGSISLIMFYLLKVTGMLRVSAEMEAAGMDVSKHGGAAYES
jgi:Amt family ammonium transporter